MKRILIKRREETEQAYVLRSFNHASAQMDHCYTVQLIRKLDGNNGAAIFYQLEAAMWYQRMVEYRDCLMNDYFPFTAVRIDALFPGDDLWTREVFNMIPERYPTRDQPPPRLAPIIPVFPTSDAAKRHGDNFKFATTDIHDQISGYTFRVVDYPLRPAPDHDKRPVHGGYPTPRDKS